MVLKFFLPLFEKYNIRFIITQALTAELQMKNKNLSSLGQKEAWLIHDLGIAGYNLSQVKGERLKIQNETATTTQIIMMQAKERGPKC